MTDKDAMTAVQGYLSKVGIQAQLDYVDARTWLKHRMSGYKNAMLAGALGFDGNLNNSFERYFTQTSVNFPCMEKSDELEKYYNDSLHSVKFEPALAQKMIRYIYENALVLPLYTITRGIVLKNYVHDGGFYTKHMWPNWEPANLWLDK